MQVTTVKPRNFQQLILMEVHKGQIFLPVSQGVADTPLSDAHPSVDLGKKRQNSLCVLKQTSPMSSLFMQFGGKIGQNNRLAPTRLWLSPSYMGNPGSTTVLFSE